jgi:hypothetical protein
MRSCQTLRRLGQGRSAATTSGPDARPVPGHAQVIVALGGSSTGKDRNEVARGRL